MLRLDLHKRIIDESMPLPWVILHCCTPMPILISSNSNAVCRECLHPIKWQYVEIFGAECWYAATTKSICIRELSEKYFIFAHPCILLCYAMHNIGIAFSFCSSPPGHRYAVHARQTTAVVWFNEDMVTWQAGVLLPPRQQKIWTTTADALG